MTEREKVIKGLKWCMNEKHDCYREKGCPYENEGEDVGCKYALHRDALELLKAQAPRVMTLEEFNAHWKTPPQERQPIWEEWKFDNGKGKWKMYGRATGGYGKLWRCWTARPDQATREATPWERSN